MSPRQHVALSLGSGTVVGLILHSWAGGTSCALMGIFIDLDHLFDFWVNRGFSLSPRKFFDFCYYGTSRRFYDILHGWEFIPLYGWLATRPGLWEVGWGLTVGYTLHLLGDQLFNTHLNRWTYFFSYRLYHGFDTRKIVLYNPFLDNRGRPL
jgi:hypothetical protein